MSKSLADHGQSRIDTEVDGPWREAQVMFNGKEYYGKVAPLRRRPGYYGVKWKGGLYSEEPNSAVRFIVSTKKIVKDERPWPSLGSWIWHAEKGSSGFWGHITSSGRAAANGRRYYIDWIPENSLPNAKRTKTIKDLIWAERGRLWRQFVGEPPWPNSKNNDYDEHKKRKKKSSLEKTSKGKPPKQKIKQQDDEAIRKAKIKKEEAQAAQEAKARLNRLAEKRKHKGVHPSFENALSWLDPQQKPVDLSQFQRTYEKFDTIINERVEITKHGVVDGFGVVAKQFLTRGDTICDPGAVLCRANRTILSLEDSHHFIMLQCHGTQPSYFKIHSFDLEDPHRVARTFYLNEARGDLVPNIRWKHKYYQQRNHLFWEILRDIHPGEELLVIYDQPENPKKKIRPPITDKLVQYTTCSKKKRYRPQPTEKKHESKKLQPLQLVGIKEQILPSLNKEKERVEKEEQPSMTISSIKEQPSLQNPISVPPLPSGRLPSDNSTLDNSTSDSSGSTSAISSDSKNIHLPPPILDDNVIEDEQPPPPRKAPLVIYIDDDSEDDDDEVIFLSSSSSDARLESDKRTTQKKHDDSILVLDDFGFFSEKKRGRPFSSVSANRTVKPRLEKRRASAPSTIHNSSSQQRYRNDAADIIVIDDSDDDDCDQRYIPAKPEKISTSSSKRRKISSTSFIAAPKRKPEVIIIDDD